MEYLICNFGTSCPSLETTDDNTTCPTCGTSDVSIFELDSFQEVFWKEAIQNRGFDEVLPAIRKQTANRTTKINYLKSCIDSVLGKDSFESLYSGNLAKAIGHSLALAYVKNLDRNTEVAQTLLKANDELFKYGFVVGMWST